MIRKSYRTFYKSSILRRLSNVSISATTECFPVAVNSMFDASENKIDERFSYGCCGSKNSNVSENLLNKSQQSLFDSLLKAQQLNYTSSNTHCISVIDAHCHLQLDPLFNNYTQHISNAITCNVSHVVVCGTCPGQDWLRVAEIYNAYPQTVIPNFGLHPWWIRRYTDSFNAADINKDDKSQNEQLVVESVDEGSRDFVSEDYSSSIENCDSNTNRQSLSRISWQSELEHYLQRYPTAGVGECGLDKGIKQEVSLSIQDTILIAHIQIAATYSRPLTLHCVNCWGRLLDVLRNNLPAQRSIPSVILHSCNSMSSDMIIQFNRLPTNIYYSLSCGGNQNSLNKALSLAKTIPIHQLLIETDSPDQLHYALQDKLHHNEPGLIRYNVEYYAKYMEENGVGVNAVELTRIVSENAKRAFGIQ